MKSKKIPVLLAVSSTLFGFHAVGQSAEHDHIGHVATASRSWLPGAMVEAAVVEPVLGKDGNGKPQMVDLVVEIQQVFTGPKSLHGARLRINPSMAFRFPPDRWSAVHMHGIHGEPMEAFRAGKRGLLWIFQRRELPTGRTGSNGKEFLFFTGFQPVWEQSSPGNPTNEDCFRQEWDQTLEMMQILGEIEGMDASRMEQAVLDLVGHKNGKVRRWAYAALARVKGVGAIGRLKHLESHSDGRAVIEDFIDQMLIYRSRDSLSESEKPSVPEISMLGVEIVTPEKREGQQTLFSKSQIEPGTVKILRVFAGSGFCEGEVVEAEGAIGKPGTKLLVAPQNGRIRLPSSMALTSFPPEGLWDGGTKRLRYNLEPEIDLAPLKPWLERLSGPDTPSADDFLEDALRDAPSLVALWALRSSLDHLRPETLNWLRVSSGLGEAGSAPTSMREMILYEQAMHCLYGKLWLWSAERIDLFERIFSYPLSDWEDAWLLINLHYEGFQPLSASVEEWKRLSLAVRQNTSWRDTWLDPLPRRKLDALAWSTVQTEALATLDASTSVDYLIERWAIPDRGESSAPSFVDTWGSSLARALPLESKEVESLRSALAQRLTTSGDRVPSEQIEKRIQKIRERTWDEILATPFP